MTARALLTSVLFVIAATLPLPATPGIVPQDRPGGAGGIQNQLDITLPDGWSVYDQNEALSGKPSAVGMVIFSAQPLKTAGAATADAELLAKADSGELASFFVERVPAKKGMECDKLSKTVIYDIGITLNRDPSVSTAGRRLFGSGIAPGHTDIELGGCHGVRFVIDAHKDDPAKHAIVDVRAVSDGKMLYLFSLRNKANHYAKNVETFEKAMTSVRFKLAK
jgi:hypothetical protein